jgi:hypothetical protein
MKIKIKKIFENAVWWSGVVTVGLVLGISLQFVRAWTEPTEAPPGGNVGAPINTANGFQWKGLFTGTFGWLGLTGGLDTVGLKTSYLQIPTGAVAGYVLTTDALGNATWQPPTGGGSPATGFKKFTIDDKWKPPAGVTEVKVTAIGGGGGGVASYWGDGSIIKYGTGNCNIFGVSGGHLYGGGGGSGGITTTYSLKVVPGNEYTVNIGAGGAMDAQHERASSGGTTRFLLGADELAHADGGQGGANIRYDCVGGSAGAGCSPGGNGGDGTADVGGKGGICPAATAYGAYGNGGRGGCGPDEASSGQAGALIIEW